MHRTVAPRMKAVVSSSRNSLARWVVAEAVAPYLFLVAFFFRNVRGSAVFFGAVLAQTTVIALFLTTNIGYLWYNLIGCAAVLLFGWGLQATIFRTESPALNQ